MKHLLLVVAAVPVVLMSASPASAAVPDPFDGGPGCEGRFVAVFNKASGEFGASGNPKASAGPGFFLRSDSAEAIAAFRQAICG